MHFINFKTVEEIKKHYRILAFKNHPDRGGDVKIMQEINAQYQNALKACDMQTSTDSNNKKHTYYYNADKEQKLAEKITALLSLNMLDVDISLIGVWIWITGETKQYKEQLKKLACKWHSKRKCWYFQDGKKARYNKKNGSLNELANKYGCKNFNSDKLTAIAA